MLSFKILAVLLLGIGVLCPNFQLPAQELPLPFRNVKPFHAADFFQHNKDYEILLDTKDLSYLDGDEHDTLKIRLKNGLEVYLISDPNLQQSSAALSVEVGSWNDPEDAPGMAHFVEHLLFMGTEKYPVEGEFSRYIGERGGEYNAVTSHDRTIYGFSSNKEGFEGALDRFSHFFIDPLFSSSSIEREKNAVHHEFEDNVENDFIKIWRVLKETGNPLHPNAVFSCGNLESLSGVSRKQVQEWYSSHYNALRMHLVVVSSMPLRKLVPMVCHFFSPINSREKERYSYGSAITSEKQKGHLIYLDPSYKNRTLQLIWEVPKEFVEGYSIGPVQLVQHALDHDGDLSLFKNLERERFANELSIDFVRVEKDHVLFLIEVSLTKRGVKQVDEVIYRCFQTISKLKEQGIPYYLYEQLYSADKRRSIYSSPVNVFDFTMETASELLGVDLETYPQKKSLPSVYNKDVLTRFIYSLAPENCIFFLMAPHRETQVELTSFEKWMGTPYTVRNIPLQKLNEWKQAPAHPHIELRSIENEVDEERASPWEGNDGLSEACDVVIDHSAHIRLCFVQEAEKDFIAACFCINNTRSQSSMKNAAMCSLLVCRLQEQLDSIFPVQERESIDWIVVPGDSKIYVYLQVEGEAIEEKIQMFFKELCRRPSDQQSFEQSRNRYLDNYTGDPDPLEHAQSIAQSLLTPGEYTVPEVHKLIPLITYEEYKAFSEIFFSEAFIEGTFYGNISAGEVEKYWSLVQPSIGNTLLQGETALNNWSRPDSFFRSAPALFEQTTHRKGNALILMLDIGSATTENWAIQKIISQILQEEFFEELRTKQQTAYRLYSWGETSQDRLLQHLAIQSSTHHPRDLLLRVEVFLENFAANFRMEVAPERINLVRNTLITSCKRKKQSQLSEEENKDITASIDALKAVSFEKVCQLAEEAFSFQNEKRIAVLVESTCCDENAAPSLEALSRYTLIER